MDNTQQCSSSCAQTYSCNSLASPSKSPALTTVSWLLLRSLLQASVVSNCFHGTRHCSLTDTGDWSVHGTRPRSLLLTDCSAGTWLQSSIVSACCTGLIAHNDSQTLQTGQPFKQPSAHSSQQVAVQIPDAVKAPSVPPHFRRSTAYLQRLQTGQPFKQPSAHSCQLIDAQIPDTGVRRQCPQWSQQTHAKASSLTASADWPVYRKLQRSILSADCWTEPC
jgi:hypothetical protein